MSSFSKDSFNFRINVKKTFVTEYSSIYPSWSPQSGIVKPPSFPVYYIFFIWWLCDSLGKSRQSGHAEAVGLIAPFRVIKVQMPIELLTNLPLVQGNWRKVPFRSLRIPVAAVLSLTGQLSCLLSFEIYPVSQRMLSEYIFFIILFWEVASMHQRRVGSVTDSPEFVTQTPWWSAHGPLCFSVSLSTICPSLLIWSKSQASCNSIHRYLYENKCL